MAMTPKVTRVLAPNTTSLVPVIVAVVVANLCLAIWNCLAERATTHPHWGFDSALAFQGVRSTLFAAVMYLLAILKRQPLIPTLEHRKQVAKLGLAFSCIPICYVMGLQRAGPVVASIYEGPMIPVATMVVVISTGQKKIPDTLSVWCTNLLPLFVTCIGSLIVILFKPESHPHHSHHALHPAGHRRGAPNEHPSGPKSMDGGLHVPQQYFLGNVFLAMVALGHAVYYAYNSKLIRHYSALQLGCWNATITAGVYGAVLFCRSVLGLHVGTVDFVVNDLFVDERLWGTMLIGLVLIQCGAYTILPWAASELSPLTIAMFNLSAPMLTAAFSHFWFKQDVNPIQIVGMLITIVALAFYMFSNNSKDSDITSPTPKTKLSRRTHS